MDFPYGYGHGAFDGVFGGPDFMAILSMVIGFILAALVICMAISFALYILRSIGLYRLAANRGMSGAGFAWIPFIGFYRIGSIADDISAKNGVKSYYRHILLCGAIINVVFSASHNAMLFPWLIRFFNSPYPYGFQHNYRYPSFSSESSLIILISLAVFVITIMALNKIYKCYRPSSSTAWTVLSVIFPFLQPIFLFVIRGSVPAEIWGAPSGYYPAQNQNWQAPPQYLPYGHQPPPGNGYYPPPNAQEQPPQYMPPSVGAPYQPPMAPNPPEPWEIQDTTFEPPPQAPWEKKD